MRGQLEQIFTFFLVSIVIVATIYLGARFIGSLVDKGCEAELTKLRDVLQEIEQHYDTIGTRQTISLPTACKAESLCMFSQEEDPNTWAATTEQPISLAAYRQLEFAASVPAPKPNVFLIIDGAIQELGIYEKLYPESLTCVPAQSGQFRIRTTGHGRTISITEAQ